MGLLDALMTGKFTDDPEQNAAMQQGLLQFGLQLMSRPGGLAQALGQSGLAAMQGVNQYKQQQFQGKLQKEQLADIERRRKQQAAEDQFREGLVSPQMQASQAALAGGGGPTVANAQRMPPVDPNMSMLYGATKAGLMSPLDYVRSQQKDRTPISLAEGTKLLEPGTYRELAANPKQHDDRTASQRNYAAHVAQGYKGSFLDYEREMAHSKAPMTSVSVNTGQKGFDNTLKLRGDFRSEPIYKAHQEVQSAYSQIKQGLSMASPAGDLAGATKVMKILDPDSVVRESELGMAMAATGLMDRVTNYATMVLKGTKLTPAQRADFGKLADALYAESLKQYNSKRSEYKGIADRNQLNEMDVLGPNPSAGPSGWSITKVP